MSYPSKFKQLCFISPWHISHASCSWICKTCNVKRFIKSFHMLNIENKIMLIIAKEVFSSCYSSSLISFLMRCNSVLRLIRFEQPKAPGLQKNRFSPVGTLEPLYPFGAFRKTIRFPGFPQPKNPLQNGRFDRIGEWEIEVSCRDWGEFDRRSESSIRLGTGLFPRRRPHPVKPLQKGRLLTGPSLYSVGVLSGNSFSVTSSSFSRAARRLSNSFISSADAYSLDSVKGSVCNLSPIICNLMK